MNKIILLFISFSFTTLNLFSSTPGLIWHTTYGTSDYNQQVSVMAIDNYDNMFAAGFVNFGTTGNILINRYDGVGNLKWNRIYNNPYPSGTIDRPVAVFPDNQAGVTVVGYINAQAVTTHIFHYNATGFLTADAVVGDTAAGSKTVPVAVIYDGASSFYMIGQLNNNTTVFKCGNTGNIVWSAPLYHAFNNQAGAISFDPNGNIIAAVYDSVLPMVIIHRYDANTGSEFAGFNSGLDSMSVSGNPIKIQVDQFSNIFIAGTGFDSSGNTQLTIHAFDTTGAHLWTTTCNSSKGYSNQINSFLLDHIGNVLISGPYTDFADTLQFGGAYKISGDSGHILWFAIDSQFKVKNADVQVDQYDNVYFGVVRTPSTISPYYSNFSFSQLSADSGLVQWNRSFDNTSDNSDLIERVNNFGDVFFVTNTHTDTSTEWFLGRIGNNAGDSTGTAVKTIADDNNLSIYPNPFATSTNIRFTATQSENIAIQLYDIAGRMLQQQDMQSVAGQNYVQFKTDATSGVYILKLQGANTTCVRQVVIY